MRTIDADAAKQHWSGDKIICQTMRRIIDDLPTIDPVHAAGGSYCWECIWGREVDDKEPKYRCVNICRDGCTQWLGSNDFCNYGEPREAQDG